jgi:hypothetical protein
MMPLTTRKACKKMASWNVSKGRKGLQKVHEHNCIDVLFIICGGSRLSEMVVQSKGTVTVIANNNNLMESQ